MSDRTTHETYDDYERSLLREVHTFWAGGSRERVAEAARIAALSPHDENPDDREREITIWGWLPRRQGVRLHTRALRRANPAFRIQVRRYPRPDVGRIPWLLRHGFVVTARTTSAARLTFGAIDDTGTLREIPTSNPTARSQCQEFLPVGRPLTTGAIDAIAESPVATGDPRTWFARFVASRPEEALEIVEHPAGRPLAARAAAATARAEHIKRWADRFALAAAGRVAPRSDLLGVAVDRPNPSVASPIDGVPVPRYEQKDGLVFFRHGEETLAAPSQDWLRYEDAAVQDGGTLLVGDTLVVYEDAADPRRDHVGGQWLNVFGSSQHPEAALVALNPVAPETFPEAILLSGRHDGNWYHWFAEYLPRALMADAEFDGEIPFLVSSRTPSTGREALRRVSGRPVVVADTAMLQRVGILHVTAPPLQVLDTTRVPWHESVQVNPAPLRALRAHLLGDVDPAPPSRRVFLRRQSARRVLTNEADLAAIAARRGYEIVDPGRLDFAEQLALYSSTTHLVSAGGAVMANYLLLPESARVLTLVSRGTAGFVLPATITSVAGVRLFSAAGSAAEGRTAANRNTWMHVDFEVPTTVAEAALDLLESGDFPS